jgi:hypothetical protein
MVLLCLQELSFWSSYTFVGHAVDVDAFSAFLQDAAELVANPKPVNTSMLRSE